MSVADKTKAVEAMQADFDRVSALLGGTHGMRQAGKMYLPQWPAEEEDSYEFRLKTSTLFNAFSHTVEQMGGKPFQKPITLSENFNDTLLKFADDIDTESRNLQVFAQDVFNTALAYGLSHILIDYPAENAARTKAEEKQIGARPYAIHLHPKRVIGFKSQSQNGTTTLTQLRFTEIVEVDENDYKSKDVEQIRVLEPGRWETHRKNAKGEWQLYAEGVTSLDFIPLVTVYTNRTGFMTGKPPLADLVDLNIKHWQSQSDQDSILHVARVPILAGIGVDEGDSIVIGTKALTKIPIGGDLKYVEHSGAAIEAGRQSLQDLEEQMRLLGAELLVKKANAVSATQASMDDRNEKSALQQMAQNLEDGLDLMFYYMAIWAGVEHTGDVTVYREFTTYLGGDQTETMLLNAANAGKLSDETFFNELKRRGHVSDDIDWDDEQERISQQGPALGMINDSSDSAI